MEEKKQEVVSDKEAKATGQSMVKQAQSDNHYVSTESTQGIVEDGFPIMPTGNQIFLEYNFAEKTKAGIILEKPAMKSPYPRVIGYGALVKSVNINDRICLKKDASVATYEDELTKVKFHIIYESAMVGIYRGTINEEEYINQQAGNTKSSPIIV